MSTVTYIVPTIGRESLSKTLASIQCWPGDEILVVGERMPDVAANDRRCRFVACSRGNDWGHAERNHAMRFAHGSHIANIDDDDWYTSSARGWFEDAMLKTPDVPVVFRMRYPNGITLWYDNDPTLRCGNVGTPMFLIPNMSERLGRWGSFVGGDFAFLESSKWRPEEYVWRKELVAQLGHNT